LLKWNHISNAVGYKVNKANSALRTYFQMMINESGNSITPEQWGTINYLIYNPGIIQTELSRIAKRDRTSVTRMLDGMEKKGLIIRKKDSRDRRVFRIYPTEKAKKIYDSIFPYVEKFNNTIKEILSEQECVILTEKLDLITDHINKIIN
jgi:MarR family transcriptional regulator, organic hydroperoxide resistance regulator